MKTFLKILIVQILTIPMIVFLFKILQNNKVSGLIAGSVFFALSLFFLQRLFYRTKYLKTFSFYGIIFHLVFAVIPLMLVRLVYINEDFSNLTVFGLQAQSFHKISESIYMIMVLCTLLDLVRVLILKIPLSHKID